jgi:hypothetical protein
MQQEKVELLTQYLTSDPERAKELLELDPKEAVKRINADGYDFTVDELNEYNKALKAVVAQEGELNEGELESVAGGIVLTGTMVAGLLLCFAGGTAIGVAAGAKWKW